MWKYLTLNGMILLLSASILWVTLFNIDPLGSQKIIALILFYLSVFLGLTALFTFIFFFLKELWKRKKLGIKSFRLSLRRGALIGIFFTSLLLLQMFRILTLYETILLAIFLSLVEYMIITSRPKSHS